MLLLAQMSFLQLLLTSVVFNTSANMLLKAGVEKLGGFTLSKTNLITDLAKAATSPFIIGGLILYGLSFILWLKVLTTNDLSRVYPIFVTCVFILTTIGSAKLFGEHISLLRITGLAIAIIGIYVIART